MNEKTKLKKRKNKRPAIIVAFCIFVLLTHGADLIRSFNIDKFLELLTYTPFLYLLLILFIIYPIEIFGVIEIWRMKKRGLYLYGATHIIWMAFWIFYFKLRPNIGHLVVNGVFILIILLYYKDMEPQSNKHLTHAPPDSR